MENVSLVIIIGVLNLQVGFVLGICHRQGFSISDNSIHFLREQLANLIPKRGPSHTTDTTPEEVTQRAAVPTVPETNLNEDATCEDAEPDEAQPSEDSEEDVPAAETVEDAENSVSVEEVAEETESLTVAAETPEISEDKLPQEMGENS